MKNLIFIIIIIFFQSCSLLQVNPCSKYKSNIKSFRASSEASSSSLELAEEKALFLAKKAIIEEIDAYILAKCNHRSFLSDSDYENKIMTVRNISISNIKIICKKTKVKKNDIISYITIEVSKSDIETELSKIK